MKAWTVMASLVLLTACQQDTGTPPSVSITSPAVGQPVNGTVQIQVAAESGAGIAKVTVYARSRNSQSTGIAVGSSTTEPFVVSWYTPGVPNMADLELYADAEDTAGLHALSDPVWVKTSNAGAPTLKSVAAYTLPPSTTAAALGLQDNQTATLARLLPDRTLTAAPRNPGPPPAPRASPLHAQAADDSRFVLQWSWQPVGGATGYRLWQAHDDLVGPYSNVFNQLATTGTQQFSRVVPDAAVGSTYYGLVTALVSGTESGLSNADPATFLSRQELDSPAPGATVTDGRPTLTWKATPGALGYLWFIATKPQATATPADWVCTNSPDSTDRLTMLYPSSCPTLKTGTYHWWVAGVSFTAQGQPDGYTISADRALTVP